MADCFSRSLWLAYTAWNADYPSAPPPQSAPTEGTSNPSAAAPPVDTLPSLSGAADSAARGSPTAGEAAPSPAELVHVRTDVLDVQIDLHGGDLVRADLPKYPVEKHKPNEPVRLLDYAPDERWVFQTGVRSASGAARAEPSRDVPQRQPRLLARSRPGRAHRNARLGGRRPGDCAQDLHVSPRAYAIDLAAGGRLARRKHLARRTLCADDARLSPGQALVLHRSVDSYLLSRPGAVRRQSTTASSSFDDLAKQPVIQTVKGGWFAAIQHHFLAAAVPPPDDAVRYQASTRGQDFVLSALGSARDVTGAMPLDYRFTLFVGPKLQDQLEAAGPKLERTVDYGYLTLLAQPLFWLLSHVEDYVGNWGWAIIIVTFMIKLAFYKLTATSGRSMAKMRKLAPRMKALQERYKDDRQALSQAHDGAVQAGEGQPGGRLSADRHPDAVLLRVLLGAVESVEMRQAPFMLWIDDLSARDPYYVLPLLMGVAMFFQTRLNPPPPDPDAGAASCRSCRSCSRHSSPFSRRASCCTGSRTPACRSCSNGASTRSSRASEATADRIPHGQRARCRAGAR